MQDKERLFELTRLMIEAGAQVKEDTLYVTVAFGDCGLQFTKRLFDISLGNTPDNRLCYILRPGKKFESVRTTTCYAEGKLEKEVFPRAFWDGVYSMVLKLKKKLFLSSLPPELPVAWDAWLIAMKNHRRQKPTRETYLLVKTLQEFINSETERYRVIRKTRNSRLQHLYEQMLHLVKSAPHSINRLRSMNVSFKFNKLAPGYYSIIDSKNNIEWGPNPLIAASLLLDRHYHKQSA